MGGSVVKYEGAIDVFSHGWSKLIQGNGGIHLGGFKGMGRGEDGPFEVKKMAHQKLVLKVPLPHRIFRVWAHPS